MKHIRILALLLPLAAAAAHAQDIAPPPPPPDTADTPAPPPTAPDANPPAPPIAPGTPDTDADLRAEVAALKAQVAAMQAQLNKLAGQPAAAPAPELTPGTPGEPTAPAEGTAAETGGGGAGKALLLPDISFIGTTIGHLSSDHRDQDRTRLFLDSGELSIQSYVYPDVKADAFITASHPDFNFAIEEAYLSVLKLGQGLSAQVGKRKVPFDRVNQLHPHSWLYVTQPYVLKDLVADESLTAEGGYLSYLLPHTGKIFAQLDAGLWNTAQPGNIQSPDTDQILTGSGAAFEDRFQTARLWTSTAMGENAELELGGSLAHGKGQALALPDDISQRPETTLSGVDLSYRHFGKGVARTLLRGEYIQHDAKSDFLNDKAKGYYLFADQRVSSYREYGLRYDWSEFPFAPGFHESGISGIVTNQLTEQTYLRLQLTHASRPGDSKVNEAWFEWVWGVGPHTHNLE